VSEISVSNVSFQFSVDNYIFWYISCQLGDQYPCLMICFSSVFELLKFMTEHLRVDSLCVVRYMGDQK